VTAFGVVVQAPRDDARLGVDHEAVVRTAGDLDSLGSAWKRADAGRVERSSVVALEETAGELGLLAGTPGVDLVLLVERNDVVQTGGKLLDFGDLRDEDRLLLDLYSSGESENTFVTLWEGEKDMLELCIKNANNKIKTYSECAPSVNLTSSCESKSRAVAGYNLDPNSVFWNI